MKMWSVYIAPTLLISTVNEGEWSVSCPGHFTSEKRAPGTHWIGGWVDPRDGLEAIEKRKTSCLWWESNPILRPSSPQPSAYNE
jgi:hypothetical protein